ncbi:hypothetical protein ACMZ62_00395 [Streptococcus pluranimalium]
MIQELNLSSTGYVILIAIVTWLIIQILKTPSMRAPKMDAMEQPKSNEPEYLARYGAVIQMQGRI